MSYDIVWEDEIAKWEEASDDKFQWRIGDLVYFKGINPAAWGIGRVIAPGDTQRTLQVQLYHYVHGGYYVTHVFKTECTFLGRQEGDQWVTKTSS